jgi:hypothetical protein
MNTEFDLNAAIQRWRENLSQSPQFRAENLDELEAHLRDAIATMQGQRLTDEEVFLVATRRLGGVHALEPEFAKINAREVWLNRALWMLLGVQLWFVLSSLTQVTSDLTVVGGLIGFGRDLNPAPGQAWATDIAVLFGVAQVAMWLLSIWGCVWFVRRREKGLQARATEVLRRPGLLALAVTAMWVVFLVIRSSGFAENAFLHSKLTVKQLGLVGVSRMWSSVVLSIVEVIALTVVTALLARRLFVKKLPAG